MKKRFVFIFLMCLLSILCFAEPKFYRAKNGYSGYAEMHYQGRIEESDYEKINQNLFVISNAFGYFPCNKDKISKAQWSIFWAAFYDQYDVRKNEIYNMTIKVSGDYSVLNVTFYDDGDSVVYRSFEDLSIFPY